MMLKRCLRIAMLAFAILILFAWVASPTIAKVKVDCSQVEIVKPPGIIVQTGVKNFEEVFVLQKITSEAAIIQTIDCCKEAYNQKVDLKCLTANTIVENIYYNNKARTIYDAGPPKHKEQENPQRNYLNAFHQIEYMA
jgi:hypothetical protein